MIEITSTELIRPDIILTSFNSFVDNLRGVDWKSSILYINIDPIPQGDDPSTLINLLSPYVRKVVANTPSTPNFAKAVKWCWSQPKGRTFLHLELDWILKEQIHMKELNKLVAGRCICVNLRAYINKTDEVCLSPCLLRTEWARRIASELQTTSNPERQLRREPHINTRGLQRPNEESIHYPADREVIADIGRDWLKTQQLVKPADWKNGAFNKY